MFYSPSSEFFLSVIRGYVSFVAFTKCLVVLPIIYSRTSISHKPPIFGSTCTHASQGSGASHSWVSPMFLCINQPGSWLHLHQALGSLWSAKSFAICLTALWLPKLYHYFLFASLTGSCLLFILLVTYSWIEIQGVKINTSAQCLFQPEGSWFVFQTRNP